MARFCNKCGSPVSEKARFCKTCGAQLNQRKAKAEEKVPQESIPNWSGFDSPAPQPQVNLSAPPPVPQMVQQPQAASFSPQPPQAQSSQDSTPLPVASVPPQFWNSYDYQEGAPPAGQDGSLPGLPKDASRLLPPLSSVFDENSLLPGAENEAMDLEELRERANETIMNFSLWCAGIVLMPVPFADIVLLLPIQSAMVVSLGKLYGIDSPRQYVTVISGACGGSVIGSITTMIAAECIPILGKIISAPLAFGWTYGMGEVAMRYFESGCKATQDELKSVFKKASKEASQSYKDNKVEHVQPNQALDSIRDYVSEDEYRRIRERFGPQQQ